MQVIEQDIFDVTEGIIVHQVNTHGVMGGGIAVDIRERYPEVYRRYRKFCDEKENLNLMGTVQPVRVSDTLVILNLFAQHLDSAAGERGRMTSYDATADAWDKIDDYRFNTNKQNGEPVFIPYGMGCGLGGGSWDVYTAIVDAVCPGVIACRL